MRKFGIVGLAVFAVFGFSVVAASPSFAVSKILLAAGGGTEITAETGIEIIGSLLLEDMNATGTPDVLCTGIFDAVVLAGGTLAYITELLNAAGVLEAGTLANSDLILCTSDKLCLNDEAAVEPYVEALNLPWHLEFTLDATKEAFLADFLSLVDMASPETFLGKSVSGPAYNLDCLAPLIGLQEDSCDGLSSIRLFNSAGGVLLGSFNSLALSEPDIWAAESEPLDCSLGGAGQELIESQLLSGTDADTEEKAAEIRLAGGGALSVSP